MNQENHERVLNEDLILKEFWIMKTEIKELKQMNHQCMNILANQKNENIRLLKIIEQQNIELMLIKCKL
uniref:Uncharacterized protein n=1 Tax=viral metagenome TaxID=1070528 RepID=A0A6C0JJS7_9ZZZZ